MTHDSDPDGATPRAALHAVPDTPQPPDDDSPLFFGDEREPPPDDYGHPDDTPARQDAPPPPARGCTTLHLPGDAPAEPPAPAPASGLYLPVAAAAPGLERARASSWWSRPTQGDHDLLMSIVDGTYDPPRTRWLKRTDGQALLYSGQVNALTSEPETGKSWLAMQACAEAIRDRHGVTYVDFEANLATAYQRLLALGCELDLIKRFFGYCNPTDSYAKAESVQAVQGAWTECMPGLVVVDGVATAMATAGLDTLNNNDCIRYFDDFLQPMARLGPAVLILDHVSKSDRQGRYASGGLQKMARTKGAAYTLALVSPLGKGREGRVRLMCTKDAPGDVRGHCGQGDSAGLAHIAGSPDGRTVKVEIHPDSAEEISNSTGGDWKGEARMNRAMERISRYLESQKEPASKNLIETAGDARAAKNVIAAALEELTRRGYVMELSGARRARLFESVKKYRVPVKPTEEKETKREREG